MSKNITLNGREYILIYDFNFAEFFKEKTKRSWWKSALLVVFIFALGLTFGIIVGKFFGKVILTTEVLVLLPVVACTFVLHEAIHGFFFWIYGGKPRFGMKVIGGWKNFLWGFVLYATADAIYTRPQYYIIGLSPLVLISVMAIAAFSYEPFQSYALFAGSANALGAVGDVYMTGKLTKFSPTVMVRDTPDGYEIYEQAAVPSTSSSTDW